MQPNDMQGSMGLPGRYTYTLRMNKCQTAQFSWYCCYVVTISTCIFQQPSEFTLYSPTKTAGNLVGQYSLKDMMIGPLLCNLRSCTSIIPYSFKLFMINSSTIVRHSKCCTQAHLHQLKTLSFTFFTFTVSHIHVC